MGKTIFIYLYSDNKEFHPRDDFEQGFVFPQQDDDFSDLLSGSSFQQDSDNQFKSDLDSSFSKLSEVGEGEDSSSQSLKKLSSFSKFKKNERKTADISEDESEDDKEEKQDPSFEPVDTKTKEPECKPQKKRKRRDVIFKRILRECRRFFQVKLSGLTGFVASKKARKDDSMYNWMEKFNTEYLDKEGTFEENFYLACLLYPQDLARNVDMFISKKEEVNKDNHKLYKEIVAKIHATLYKYSHDKLDYFVSVPEISNLFLYFYNNGAEGMLADPKVVEELELIKEKWGVKQE